MMEEKLYRIMRNLPYDGVILEPGGNSDLKKFSEDKIKELKRDGVICDLYDDDVEIQEARRRKFYRENKKGLELMGINEEDFVKFSGD